VDHDGHEDGADLAAACGGEAICEGRRAQVARMDLGSRMDSRGPQLRLALAAPHRSQPGFAGLARSAGVSNPSHTCRVFLRALRELRGSCSWQALWLLASASDLGL